MENQFRVMLLVTTMGVMIGEGCSDPSHQHFNFTDPGLIFYLILFNSHIDDVGGQKRNAHSTITEDLQNS